MNALHERRALSTSRRELVVFASIMNWELCYFDEWINYHRAFGVQQFYMLPQWDNRNLPRDEASEHEVRNEEAHMRRWSPEKYSRVHAICNVSGHPGSCSNPRAWPYYTRGMQVHAMVVSIAPLLDETAWLTLIDVDEFIQVPPQFEFRLNDVLQIFDQWKADIVRVHWLVFGPNSIASNPSCSVLNTFRRPAWRSCVTNKEFKTLFRNKRGLQAVPSNFKYIAHRQVQGPNYFTADGINFTATVSNEFGVPAPQHPLLEIRHYITRSVTEFQVKIARYRRAFSADKNDAMSRGNFQKYSRIPSLLTIQTLNEKSHTANINPSTGLDTNECRMNLSIESYPLFGPWSCFPDCRAPKSNLERRSNWSDSSKKRSQKINRANRG